MIVLHKYFWTDTSNNPALDILLNLTFVLEFLSLFNIFLIESYEKNRF